jgi:hypothetical protein
MALEPDLVAFATNLYLDIPLSESEATELGRLLDNREELFAYVLTRPEIMQKHPEIREEIVKLAQEHGHDALTKREAVGQPAAMRNVTKALELEILAAIEGDFDRTIPNLQD